MIDRIINDIKIALNNPLPGNRAHQEMISYSRPSAEVIRAMDATPKESAVLILLYKLNDRLCFPLILRPEYDGVHSRQIGLPGGQKEKQDKDLIATAIRETYEEIGATVNHINILGELTEIYIPPSNFLVKPVVAYYDPISEFKPDKTEVSRILTSSLNELIDLRIEKKEVFIRHQKHQTTVSCFIIEEEIVWGATAMILSELRTLIIENEIL
ncbi:MAG: coenzyme A pyrophosphatase [Bacteroidetes bacterium]|nr:MAG: coenzyme A pyrophosphatase [Bacteroidota bacterium]